MCGYTRKALMVLQILVCCHGLRPVHSGTLLSILERISYTGAISTRPPLASHCPSCTPGERASTPRHEENRRFQRGRRSMVQRPAPPGAVRLDSTPSVSGLQGPGSMILVSSTTNTEGLLLYLEKPLPGQGSCAEGNLGGDRVPTKGT